MTKSVAVCEQVEDMCNSSCSVDPVDDLQLEVWYAQQHMPANAYSQAQAL